ncbi:hypothetical protein PENARI_c002G04668 [Penicillium arizonense]|uniref:Uncharacterized protein n=1 Tax=Penicillium arizonense TaxID=1835702 RepID=A0A1F5LUW4_PENAI|nr:hypothetical protein PENARI_c002G04668 [Penicillium arizonense]OGE56977.1 hypothetical protein PENARI_c002G04668 [Penicillium arizonense]
MGCLFSTASQEPDDYATGDGSLAYRSGQRAQPSYQTRSSGVSPPCPVLVKLQPARKELMTASLPQGYAPQMIPPNRGNIPGAGLDPNKGDDNAMDNWMATTQVQPMETLEEHAVKVPRNGMKLKLGLPECQDSKHMA